MTPSEEIMQFLKDNPTFYLATVDGYLPRVRPLGFAMVQGPPVPGHRQAQSRIQAAVGQHQPGNLRLQRKGEFLRVQGTANFDNTPKHRPPHSRLCRSWPICTTRKPA